MVRHLFFHIKYVNVLPGKESKISQTMPGVLLSILKSEYSVRSCMGIRGTGTPSRLVGGGAFNNYN